MSPGSKIFGQFLGLALVTTAMLLALGYAPTRRLAGEEALPAMLAGCLASFVASLVGILPVLAARNQPHIEAWTAAMIAMVVRLGIVIVAGMALALGGIFPHKPLLLWVVISHAGLLIPDTALSIKVLAKQKLAKQKLAKQALMAEN